MNNNGVVIAGSFDPVTKGHTTLIARATNMFGKVTVVVANNANKNYMFGSVDRILQIQNACTWLGDKVQVIRDNGLVVDTCSNLGVNTMVRGVRDVDDFVSEQRMNDINRIVDNRVNTVLMLADANVRHISSSAVKELHRNGFDVSEMVSAKVLDALDAKAKVIE